MAVHKKKMTRIITWTLVLLVIAGIIFYPKIRPLFRGGKGDGGPAMGQAAPGGAGLGMPGGPGMRGGMGQQPTMASGYVLVPTRMFDLMYSTGSLLPDEEVGRAHV